MRPRPSSITSPAALLCALAVAACAHPNPGVNAAASAAQAPPDVPLAGPPTVGEEVAAVASNQVVILFSRGATMLSGQENRKLDLAARLFRDANPTLMFVTGHSDASGEEYGNLVLSGRRAQSVKGALVARGIPADRLLLQAMGTSDPVSADAVTAPDNRRVVITWRLL